MDITAWSRGWSLGTASLELEQSAGNTKTKQDKPVLGRLGDWLVG